MEFNDLIFYVLDIAILAMLVRMLNASRRVELEVKAGSTLYVAIAFFLIALAGLLRYQGAFRWIQTAALVVMGDRDPDFADPGAEARLVAGRLGARVAMMPGTGHYPQVERPAAVARAIMAAAGVDR